MQKYTQDYTLIREAMEVLYSATRLHSNECHNDVLEHINKARTILTQYLSQDNMVQDDDVYDGYYKVLEAEKEIARLKEQLANVKKQQQSHQQ